MRIPGTRGRRGPDRALVLSFRGRCFSMGPTGSGLHLGAEGECIIANRSVSSSVRVKSMNFPNNVARFEDGQEIFGELLVPLTPEAVGWIEEHRLGKDLSVLLRLVFTWQEVAVVQGSPSGAAHTAGKAFLSQQTPSFEIAQSEWIRLLTQMECEEWRLVELPVQPLIGDPQLKAGLEYVAEAEKLLRQGDYDGCMAECRRSFESIAQHHASGDSRRGYDLLLARAFVAAADEPKRALVVPLLRALNDFTQPLGRHATAPTIPVTRSEAEMVLSTSLAILSMVTRAIAANERENRLAARV